MKVRIAAFKSSYGTTVYIDERASSYCSEYSQCSEFTDVELVELPPEIVLLNQVMVLDKKIEAINNEAIGRVNAIVKIKQELLAITHQES